MRIVIVGSDLPGRSFCRDDGSPLDNVHVGPQIRSEPAELVAGDAGSARWELDVDLRVGDEGGLDFRGPAVHGKRGERFLYLTWGNVGDDGAFEMFRRAKLMLNRVDPALVRTADTTDRPLIGSIRLRDGRGEPRCARVDAPDLRWSVG